jgi:hypothetical protein
LAFRNRDLMPQDEDLGVLVPIAHRKKTQDRERVRHRQIVSAYSLVCRAEYG